jgi:lipopolysaccharide export LptBFGC system permease protein LptF
MQEYHLDTQMNFLELEEYINELKQSGYGYDTVKLEIQLYRKFAVPLFALIMAMIGMPFGFLVGNRGADRYRRQHRHRAFLSGDIQAVRESGGDQRT